jgi:hypothetical protein
MIKALFKDTKNIFSVLRNKTEVFLPFFLTISAKNIYPKKDFNGII